MKFRNLLVALTACSLLFAPVQAQAQDEEEIRHEIAVSYGTVPNSVWIDVFTELIPAMFGVNYQDHRFIGPIGLEYYYHTSPMIGVGAVAVFATNNEDGYIKEVKTSHMTKSYFTFMPSVKFNWLRKKNWGMYSKVALGATYIHFTDKDVQDNEKTTAKDLVFNFHASLLGIEAGSQHVRGFAELGVGEQGIALAGLRFRF